MSTKAGTIGIAGRPTGFVVWTGIVSALAAAAVIMSALALIEARDHGSIAASTEQVGVASAQAPLWDAGKLEAMRGRVLAGSVGDRGYVLWDAGKLDAFIEGQDCLRRARGKILERGACRNPWQNLVNLRLAWTSPPLHRDGHRFEVQLDVFNLMNLLDSDWGLFRQAAGAESHGTAFLRAVGYDAANDRPIYSFAAPANVVTTVYSPVLSRWRIQLGARYSF